jgi:hypothetical protein
MKGKRKQTASKTEKPKEVTKQRIDKRRKAVGKEYPKELYTALICEHSCPVSSQKSVTSVPVSSSHRRD